MVTIYDLLEVDENASKEEIEKSYQKLVLEYKIDPILSEQENKENEMILNKMKIAYEILINDEKRKKYDNDLAKKRAEELIKNVTPTSNEEISNIQKDAINEKIKDDSEFYDKEYNKEIEQDEEIKLTNKEKKEVRKAAEREFKQNLKKAQQYEEEYNQAYNKAYKDYLKKIGYAQKEPLTLKRIKDTIITLLVIILICFMAWKIPPINKLLVGIYNENFIIKSFVDLVRILLNAIMSIFK